MSKEQQLQQLNELISELEQEYIVIQLLQDQLKEEAAALHIQINNQ
jgi:hypothetical protein